MCLSIPVTSCCDVVTNTLGAFDAYLTSCFYVFILFYGWLLAGADSIYFAQVTLSDDQVLPPISVLK